MTSSSSLALLPVTPRAVGRADVGRLPLGAARLPRRFSLSLHRSFLAAGPFLLAAALMVPLAGCGQRSTAEGPPAQAEAGEGPEIVPWEELVSADEALGSGLSITTNSDRALYAPGSTARIDVTLTNQTGAAYSGHVDLFFRQRGRDVAPPQVQQVGNLAPGASVTLSYRLQTPAINWRGYHVEIWAYGASGTIVASAASAVDVSTDWTRFPRYGYVTKFESGTNAQALVRGLNRYHLNGLQFYDVNYEHHRPYSPNATWPNLANVTMDRGVVNALIEAAHAHGMMAMNYNLWDGVYDDYWKDGSGVPVSWGLFKTRCAPNCTPANQLRTPDPGFFPKSWVSSLLYQVNPANPDWQRYFFAKNAELYRNFAYDGWHIDTLGNPGARWDFNGNPAIETDALVPFTNAAKVAIGNKRVLINNVGRWGIRDVAQNANVDFVYAELWHETERYGDLNEAVKQVREVSAKPVVFPAYMNTNKGANPAACPSCTFSEASIRLVDSAMLASGAVHLEMGDFDKMISNIYWPMPMLPMTKSLADATVDLAHFSVAYQNLLRYGVADASNAVSVEGVATSRDGSPKSLWILPKTKAGFQIVHFINLTGNSASTWRDEDAKYVAPPAYKNLPVKLYYQGSITPGTSRLMYATPDFDHGKPYALSYTAGSDAGGNFIRFTLPRLWYWDLVYLETNTLSGSDYTTHARGLIEGEHYVNAASGAGTLECLDVGGGKLLGNAGGGRWAQYEAVDFGAGVSKAQLRVATAVGGTVELRTGSPTGKLLGSGRIEPTGGWQKWSTATIPVSGAAGVQDLFLVFPGGAINVNSFQFL